MAFFPPHLVLRWVTDSIRIALVVAVAVALQSLPVYLEGTVERLLEHNSQSAPGTQQTRSTAKGHGARSWKGRRQQQAVPFSFETPSMSLQKRPSSPSRCADNRRGAKITEARARHATPTACSLGGFVAVTQPIQSLISSSQRVEASGEAVRRGDLAFRARQTAGHMDGRGDWRFCTWSIHVCRRGSVRGDRVSTARSRSYGSEASERVGAIESRDGRGWPWTKGLELAGCRRTVPRRLREDKAAAPSPCIVVRASPPQPYPI